MSSNTLRGIGQEGDRQKDDDAESHTDDGGPAEERGDGAARGASGTEPGMPSAPGPFPDIQKLWSLDSTVPGTRSLDSSVPHAEPSLDGRVPNLSATLLGVSAPVVVAGRLAGTVQGRDVHLPAEEWARAAKSHAIAGALVETTPPHSPTPQPITDSEPTIAEPIAVPVRSSPTIKTTADGFAHDAPHSGLGRDAPWYDQDLDNHRTYEGRRTNVLGRVAIGAAMAAALAVVLFAIVRFNISNGSADESDQAGKAGFTPRPIGRSSPISPPPATLPESPPTPGEPAVPQAVETDPMVDSNADIGLPTLPSPTTRTPPPVARSASPAPDRAPDRAPDNDWPRTATARVAPARTAGTHALRPSAVRAQTWPPTGATPPMIPEPTLGSSSTTGAQWAPGTKPYKRPRHQSSPARPPRHQAPASRPARKNGVGTTTPIRPCR